MARAIALLSGGLDSTLSVLLLRRQQIEVTAVTFLTHFGCDMGDKSSCSSDSTSNAARYGFEVKMCHLSDKFIDIVKNPKFGHGKNMNPCIDCRVLMLREAKELMRMRGADFIATGEVLGQRPMSQRRDTFPLIDREAGVTGLVLRPLSARLLKPTVAEETGLVDRDLLCGFAGRTRKPQMALAAEFGLMEYPAPAGGCLLTDPNYSYRLEELLAFAPDPSYRDFHLLRVGRHFRLPLGKKVVVGRDQAENERIEALSEPEDFLLRVQGVGSPLALLPGDAALEDVMAAARLCARYSDAKHFPEVSVRVEHGGEAFELSVTPATDRELEELRVQKLVRAR
jgi:tRNA-specific 2-thiouridylase